MTDRLSQTFVGGIFTGRVHARFRGFPIARPKFLLFGSNRTVSFDFLNLFIPLSDGHILQYSLWFNHPCISQDLQGNLTKSLRGV